MHIHTTRHTHLNVGAVGRGTGRQSLPAHGPQPGRAAGVAKGHVENTLVAQAVVSGKRLAMRIVVLHRFKQHSFFAAATDEHAPRAASTLQSPNCLVSVVVQDDVAHVHTQALGQKGRRFFQIGRGQGDGSNSHRAVHAALAVGLRQGIGFHDLDKNPVGVAYTGTALAKRAQGWRQCNAALGCQIGQCGVKVGHPNATAAVAQVTRAVVGRHQRRVR